MGEGVEKRTRTRRTAPATRALILEEAERSLIENGYKQTSIADIATALHMSPANVFKHFHSKAELAHAVIASRFRPENEIRGETVGDRLRSLLCGILSDVLTFSREEPRLFDVMGTIIAADDAAEMLRSKMVAKLDDAIAGGSLPATSVPLTEMLADIFLCVLHPAIIASTGEEQLRARADNLLAFIDLAVSPRAAS